MQSSEQSLEVAVLPKLHVLRRRQLCFVLTLLEAAGVQIMVSKIQKTQTQQRDRSQQFAS